MLMSLRKTQKTRENFLHQERQKVSLKEIPAFEFSTVLAFLTYEQGDFNRHQTNRNASFGKLHGGD